LKPSNPPNDVARRQRWVASTCALAVGGAYFTAHQLGIMAWNGADRSTPAMAFLVCLLAGSAAVLPWLPESRRNVARALASLLVGVFVFRFLLIVPLVLGVAVLRISRTSWPTWRKVALVLGIWLTVVLLCWVTPRGFGMPYRALGAYLACLPAPLICLVVERARGMLDDVDPLQEWLYLLGAPRVVVPFLQPVGAARLIRSRREEASYRLPLTALGLALLGIAGCAALRYTGYHVKGGFADLSLRAHGPTIAENVVHLYAVNATAIFVVVPMYRLLGYDLGSGFRFPFLATSFAEFYRRWNYYYFEYVSTIFYQPLVSWLRRRLPLKAAYVLAGYPSFLLGAWALDKIFLQLPASRSLAEVFSVARNWQELGLYFAVWTLVIGSQLLLGPIRSLRRFWWWRLLGWLVTVGTVLTAVTLLYVYQLTIY
jgi:hypothetical protein